MRIAETATSTLGLPETSLAIIPGAGGTQRLPRIIGMAKAKELIYTARRLNAKEAYEMGIANYAVDDAFAKSLEIARQILPNVCFIMCHCVALMFNFCLLFV